MSDDSQIEKARIFRALHQAAGILLLPNAWDVITARVFEDCGFAAVGTTSFGIARAHGFRDGENNALECSLAMVRRMASALSVPLTADIEAGYGTSADAVQRNGRAFIDAGAVGLNIEDGAAAAPAQLADVALQTERIAALREAADSAGVPVFVNARTDVFWLEVGPAPARLDAALRRAEAYLRAGADGIFVPGLTEPDAIARVVAGVQAPLNVLAGAKTPSVSVLAGLGVRRLSLGSGPMRATLALLRKIGRELLAQGSYGFLENTVGYDEANDL